MNKRDHIPLVADMVKDCESYLSRLSADRVKAIEYYDGTMKDTLPDADRSSVVSRDVREQVQKVLPSLTRTFLASDRIVEFLPGQEGDDELAEQQTDYINYVVFPESDGPRALEDSIHDALKARNGIMYWWFDEKTSIKVSRHSGLDDASFAKIVAEDGVKVLEHTSREEVIETPEGPMPSVAHDFKIRRSVSVRKPCVKCVPLDEFLIHPDAIDEETAACIGTKSPVRRSDLVAMGYDRKQVDKLPALGADGIAIDEEKANRSGLDGDRRTQIAHELEMIDYYELYVRIDVDGDGIAELRRMCFGGKISSDCLLDDEEADEAPFAIIKTKGKPHQWEGVSIADDVMDIQRIKTVLLRNTLDNLYWQNNPQLGVRRDLVSPESISAVTNPKFGQTVWLEPGASAAEAMQPITIPFVAEKSFAMLSYMDDEKTNRTGISDASGGLPPDALQNVTAKASAMMEQGGIGQAELMARTLAFGFKRMFRGLLRLVIKHQDKPRSVRLRDKWVTFDPRQWNADLDCTVNTGLGAGTRERDVMMISGILGAQEKVLAAYGPQNPYVTPENLGNSLLRLAEATGARTPTMYFSKPTEEQVQSMKEAQANKPDPEIVKLEKQLANAIELKKMDMQVATHKETVQGQAAVEQAVQTTQIEAQAKEKDRQLKKYEIDTKAQLELLKMQQQQAFDREQSKASREHDAHQKLTAMGMDIDEEGKPYDKANKTLQDMMQLILQQMEMQRAEMSKPRVVTTPDGETFTMGTVN